MSDYDTNGELHHTTSAPLDPKVEAAFDQIQARVDDHESSVLITSDPVETLVFSQEELRTFQALRTSQGLTGPNYALVTHSFEQNLASSEGYSSQLGPSEPDSAEQTANQMFDGKAVPVLLRQIRKTSTDAEFQAQVRKEKNEAKHVLQVLNERMQACEDWLRLLGEKNPKPKRIMSGTAFFPMAATGLLRDFDSLWNNFWNIRLRRGLPIPENPPDERLLNQASSHAFRCEHGDADVEFLKRLPVLRQVAIEYYSHIEQYFQDPRNAKTDALIAVFQDESRYFRVRLARQEWFQEKEREIAIREIEGLLLGFAEQQATAVSPAMQRELKAATYGKHKDVSQNPLLRKIFGHESTEQTMVFLEPGRLVNKRTGKERRLSDTVNSASFFTGELVTRVVKPLEKIDPETNRRMIVGSESGVSHRDLDGVESHKKIEEATSGLANRYQYLDGDPIKNALRVEPIIDDQLANELPPRAVLTERFGQHTIPLERYQKIRGKLEQVRQLYEVPRAVKEQLQTASSFTLPDVLQLACHSLGMEAGQMVVMQKNSSESLLDVAFSIANDDLLSLSTKVASGEATQEEQHTYTTALLGTSSRFIREKAWAMQGKGSASFFATLAGQKRRLEWVSKVVGDIVVGPRFVDGVNRQQFMISVPSNTAILSEKRPERSRVTSFYSAQTDSLAMDASTQRDGMGAIGVVDSPEEGLVLSIRKMPDQSWMTIQQTINQLPSVDASNKDLVINAYRDLVFKGNDQALRELQQDPQIQMDQIHATIETAIQKKIDQQLQDLDKHIEVVLDALLKLADDYHKHPRNKFRLFSPDGELDGWKKQIQNEEQQSERERGVKGALVGVWGSITGRRKE